MALTSYFTQLQRMKAEEMYDACVDVWPELATKEAEEMSDMELEDYLDACGMVWKFGDYYSDETLAMRKPGDKLPY